MHILPRLALSTCLLVLLQAVPAMAAERFALDPVHTRVMVAIDHAGYSRAIGTVSGSTGVLEFDPADWRQARLEARVPLQRLDFGDAAWNRAVAAANLLDADRVPEAVFVSTHVEPVSDDEAIVHGQLTLRGVSRPLALQVRMNALKRTPLPPFRRTAGFSATGTLSRSDFGIDAWPSMIGDAVELRIEAEAFASRTARFGDEMAPGTAPAASTPGVEPAPAR
ncbi:polyisoprenoid-binding protein [Luteimonas yindakuii]|uniref:Polyisoprenoid-binding protein n=1 Tax=Luteimonas yindakuii TaxID=2565782 RepID=A0A4Z1RFF0_9GAMM|nr:YceI family protein [Luteimonas yindakuii]TKS53397.1 polyisoprenoid-binding protein [Luteimonas yindakuii]